MEPEKVYYEEKKEIRRLSFRSLAEDLVHLFEVDRGILYTLKSLSVHPGLAVRKYLGRERFIFTNPFRALTLLAAMATVVALESNLFTEISAGFTSGAQDNPTSEAALAFQDKVYGFFFDYFNLITLACIPIMAISTRLFYRRKEFNYVEHLVINAYVMLLPTILFIIACLLYILTAKDLIVSIYFVLSILYQVYAYTSIFQKNIITGTLKAILVTVVQYILIIIIFTIGVIVYLATNPELLNVSAGN